MYKITILFLIASFLTSGCATSLPKEILEEEPAHNRKEFSVSKDVLYQATVKAIYSKAFVIEKEDRQEGFILAKKYFRKGKRNIIVALQAKIISDRENKSTLYINALETTERLYVSDHTRFFLFIIPLPGGGGREATTIKEGERTVTDKKFYKGFFSIIEEEINNAKYFGDV